MAKKRAIIVTGLGGASFPFGVGYSSGLYTLENKLKAFGVETSHHMNGFMRYENLGPLCDILLRELQLGKSTSLIGHSLGADMVTYLQQWAAQKMPSAKIPVVACFDATAWPKVFGTGPVPIENNVTTAFAFYQKWLPGGGTLTAAKGSKVSIVTKLVSEPHIAVDDDIALHNLVVRAVQASA